MQAAQSQYLSGNAGLLRKRARVLGEVVETPRDGLDATWDLSPAKGGKTAQSADACACGCKQMTKRALKNRGPSRTGRLTAWSAFGALRARLSGLDGSHQLGSPIRATADSLEKVGIQSAFPELRSQLSSSSAFTRTRMVTQKQSFPAETLTIWPWHVRCSAQ